jgi:hypothetical protein
VLPPESGHIASSTASTRRTVGGASHSCSTTRSAKRSTSVNRCQFGITDWDGGISLDEVSIVREGAVRGTEIIERLERNAVGVRSSPETAPVPSPVPRRGIGQVLGVR